jgi:hypothetical protein
MPALVAGIHVLKLARLKDMDGRDIGVQKHAVLRTAMPGHDKERYCPSAVMPGFMPGIHVLCQAFKQILPVGILPVN